MTEHFVIALVSSPFGIKGFVKVRPLSGEFDHILQLTSVTLRSGSQESIYEIEEITEMNSVLLMKFRGIDTPEAALSLNKAELVVERSQAAALNEDEYYIEDLKGITVFLGTPEGSPVGEITDVVEAGGGALIEIRLHSGKIRLVPFRKEFFGPIDPENRLAVLLEGWILE